MADINGVTLGTSTPLPKVSYKITYTSSRPSNTQMEYEFKIVSSLGSSGSYLGTGYAIQATLTVNGAAKSVQLKANSDVWSGTAGHSKTVTITCTSTTHPANLPFKFQTKSNGTISDTSGILSNSSYTVATKALLYTAAGAPTTFTVSPGVFETDINFSWSGAKAGTNNSISKFWTEYCTSANNSTWGGWTGHINPKNSSGAYINGTSGSCTTTVSLTRGQYVKFRIRTEGSAGSSYYSGWKESGSIRKNSAPTAPTSFNVSQTTFDGDEDLTLVWSGASDPDNNIKGYNIEFRKSVNNVWGSWGLLKTIASTATGGSTTHSSPNIQNGEMLQYRIQTKDNFDVLSGFKESAVVTRDDFTGLKVYMDGNWVKVEPFVCIEGAWRPAKAFTYQQGNWYAGQD